MAVTKEDLLPLFQMNSFANMWIVINNKYNLMEFKDNISDEQRISEYKWITQQLRKYISKQQNVVLKHDTLKEMLNEIEALISKAEEYGDSRREIVYNIMRDEWLIELYHIIELNIDDNEEDEYGWAD